MQQPSSTLRWANVLETETEDLVGSLALDEVGSVDGSVALIVRGVVDDDTVEYFERTLDMAVGTASDELVIDLTHCQLASAGLAALIRHERRSRNCRAATRLVSNGVDQIRMLQIVGLTTRFQIHATLAAAFHSCRTAAVLPAAAVNGASARPSKPKRPRRSAPVMH